LGIVKALIAGVGNVLRGDDAFGVAVVQRLSQERVPASVKVIEVGIGGIHLVQELMEPVDVLIVVDALDFGRKPGTLLVVEPDVEDVSSLSVQQRHDLLADMHYATPDRAFMLARGLEVLPQRIWIVGCQPRDAHHLGEGLSSEVAEAIGPALAEVRRLVRECGIDWPEPSSD
jgi:hydrogenase maturation protease